MSRRIPKPRWWRVSMLGKRTPEQRHKTIVHQFDVTAPTRALAAIVAASCHDEVLRGWDKIAQLRWLRAGSSIRPLQPHEVPLCARPSSRSPSSGSPSASPVSSSCADVVTP